jgi:hypothetical protein
MSEENNNQNSTEIKTDEKQQFNLNEIMSNLNLKDYMGQDPELDKKLKELDEKRKNDLKQKLRQKTNNMKNNRLGKSTKEQTQINALKQNPMFQNIQNTNNEDIKRAIETMASSFSKDPRQKKNIKKQVEKLVEKMKEPQL